jgi:hypothetical protein
MQFLWTDFGDDNISWRDIILHFHMHSRFSSVRIFYWQHAGINCILPPFSTLSLCLWRDIILHFYMHSRFSLVEDLFAINDDKT